MPTNYDLGLLEKLGFKPLNLPRTQIVQESGGAHRWTTGPKKGQIKVSEAGAVGIAQVMPTTGPEAARLAGLPWDEKRFREDAEYNLRLGDAYQGMLNQKFGKGTEAAKAAYHQGPGKVEKALRIAAKTGGDWRDHIGPKGQQYIGYKGKGKGMTDSLMAGVNKGLTDRYYGGGPSAGETARYSDGVPAGPAAIATPPDPEGIKRDLGTYGTMSESFMQSVLGAMEPLKANAAMVAENLQAVAQTKHNIATDFATRAKDLESKIIPLQERRQALLNRLTELDAMSPLERRLKAAFNSDYDPRALRGRAARIDEQLSGYMESYDELNKVRSGVAALAVDAEGADVAVLNATSESILSDARLLKMGLDAVGQNIDARLLPMSIQNKLSGLALQQKNTLLGEASPQQLTQWFTQAQNSPDGTLTVDGVQLTVGELQGASRQAEQQELSFRSLTNAVAVSDINTAQILEDETLSRMTGPQLDEAMKNGGVYRGHQFPIDKVVAAVSARKQLDVANVEDVLMGTANGQAGAMLHGLSATTKMYGARIKEMFGTTPPEMSALGVQLNNNVGVFMKGLEEAKARGVAQEYIASQIPTIQSWQKGLDGQVSELAKRWGGGKAELTAVADSYLRGQPLNGEAATKGLIAIARSGMPSGSRMEGPALAAIQAATSIVRQFDNPAANANAGDAFEQMMKGGSAKEKEVEMIRRVQTAVSAVYADNLTNAIFNDLPTIAKKIRAEDQPGKVHPFARVSKDDFIAAVRHGDSEGYRAVGEKLGLDATQTQKMIAEGVDGNIWQTIKKAKKLNDGQFNDYFEQVQALQMTGMLQALDSQKRDGFSPAKAFVDFIQRPEARAQIDSMARGYGQSGFGAFLVSNSAGGGFSDAWDGYAQGVSAAYTQLHSANLRNTIAQQRRLTANPVAKANAILAAMDITQGERQLLLNAAKPLLNAGAGARPGLGADLFRQITGQESSGQSPDASFDQFTYVINNHKFEDPQVERIRQKAARNWSEMSAVIDSVSKSLSE